MKNKTLLTQLAYFGVLIIAIVFIISAVFNQLDVDIKILNTILKIAREVAVLFMVIVVAFVGFEYAQKQPPLTKLIFIIAAVLGVLASFMGVLGAF